MELSGRLNYGFHHSFASLCRCSYVLMSWRSFRQREKNIGIRQTPRNAVAPAAIKDL